MTCLKQRFLWILPDYARFTQNMNNMPNYAKNILAKKATTFLPKEWKLCPIFKIWQKLCQNGSAGLSSHNLKTASDVLYDKSHVTIVHSQCHKKRILIVIHLNPLRRTVFHIFSEVHSTLILLQNVLLITTWLKTWVEQKQIAYILVYLKL